MLGLGRDDLAAQNGPLSGELAKGNAAAIAAAYGGNGFQISYGSEQAQNLRVLAVNAVTPLPAVYPDQEILSLAFLPPTMWLAAPSSTTVTCVMASNGGAVKDAEALAKAKTAMLAATDGQVLCRRTDPGRPFSIEMTYAGSFDVSLGDRAAKLTGAIDQLWQAVAA